MATFIPTEATLIELAELTSRPPNDPMVAELFDQLVLRGHLMPFVPGWWEICRLNQRVVLSVARRCGLSC